MLFVSILRKITSDFFREILLLLFFFVVGLCNISCQLCRDLRRLLIDMSPLRSWQGLRYASPPA